MRVPCHGCQDRKAGCHGQCEKYRDFRKEKEAGYAKRLALNAAHAVRAEGFHRWEIKEFRDKR